MGAEYEFCFDAAYDWRGRVVCVAPDRAIEWELTRLDDDWIFPRVSLDFSDWPEGISSVRLVR